MDNTALKIRELLDTDPQASVDATTTAELGDAHPAFLLPLVLQLRHPHPDMDDDTVARLVNRLALSLPDPSRTRILIDPEGTGWYDNFYPATQARPTPSTGDAIDTFLATYGNIDPAEEALLNRMIFNPVPDYAATLERETPSVAPAADEQDRLLDAFIAADHTHPGASQVTAAEVTADKHDTPVETSAPSPAPRTKAPSGSLLSESLAKIFIKQHNYRRAYEIISSLHLNYPEKSVYFADQLRFLQKLIANQDAQQEHAKQQH